jgi:signal transduction histidine kinase
MRLMPRSMAGQLIGLLLLGLLIAHLIALLAMQQRNEAIHPLSRHHMLDRIASAYQVARLSAPDAGRDLLRTVSTDGARFWLDAAGSVVPHQMTEEELRLGRDLNARLGQQGAPQTSVRIAGEQTEQADPSAPQRLGLHASVRLPDGRWLNSWQQSIGKRPWWRPLGFSVPVSTLPVLLVVIIFVRRILRPIKALEQAAERVSRGEHVGPLPVTGPSEAREVTAAFNIMEERLTRFVDDRTRMLAAISHDFRTPITSLRLRAELIDEPALRAAMARTLDDMSVMVEETLRFSRDDSVNEDTQETDLVALVREVIEDQAALEHDVAWSGPGRLPYRCRPLSIKRALTNLVDNAVRYGRHISIRVTPGSPGADIRIEVDDDGPGIDTALLERAFEPFARLDPARNQETGGVGLGLTIARSCIEAHGGRLMLANRPEGGLTATIVLPA